MYSERIDYFYVVSSKSDAAVLLIASLILLGPFVYLGARTSWLITGIGFAIFVPALAYVGVSARSKRIRAKNPALSLLEENFAVLGKDKTAVIAYNALKSIVVDTGRGIRNMTILHFTEGHLDELTFDTIGLAVGCDSILESIAQRVPTENKPRLGKGVLFCTPFSDDRKLHGRSS